MAVFAVIQPQSPPLSVLENKVESFPHIKVRDGFWFIQAGGTAQDVSSQLGVTSGETGSAIILKVSSYYGRAATDLWDWIQTHWE